MRRELRKLALAGGAALLLILTACQRQAGTTTTPAVTLSRPAYHFTLRLPANWVLYEEHDEPSASSPYFLDIQRASVNPAPANSLLNMQIIKTSTQGISALINTLPKDSRYHVITLNGVKAYAGTPQTYYTQAALATSQATPSAATPPPGTPGTVTHIDYEVPTPTYLYILYTESVAGDNADAALSAMIQSLTITP